MGSSEAVEVEAQVIEDGGALTVRFSPATIEADFGALERRVGEIVERYGNLAVDPDDEGQVKGAKETRAYLRSVKAQIDERRKAVEAEYSRPLQEFKDRVRLVTGRLDGAIGVVDAQVKEGERRYRERKAAHLEGHYLDFAPLLAPVVPFERLLDPKWLNKGCRVSKAESELEERVSGVARDWEALKARGAAAPAVEAEFFRTLDLGAALAYEAKLEADARRIEEMRRQVEGGPGPEPAAEDAPEPPPAPAAEPPAPPRPPAPPAPEPAWPWVVVVESATRRQAEAAGRALAQAGISGRFLRGTLAEAHAREAANGRA